MSDAIRNDIPGCVLCLLHSLLPGGPVEKYVQLGDIGDPPAIDFAFKLNYEPHVSIIANFGRMGLPAR